MRSGTIPSRAINSRRRGLAEARIRAEAKVGAGCGEGAVNPAALIAVPGRPGQA